MSGESQAEIWWEIISKLVEAGVEGVEVVEKGWKIVVTSGGFGWRLFGEQDGGGVSEE